MNSMPYFCYRDYLINKKSFVEQVKYYSNDTNKTISCEMWLNFMNKYLIKK